MQEIPGYSRVLGPVETTSGGGTGNYTIALAQGHLSELQAGGGVLMDQAYVGMGVKGHQPSLFVLTQIISVPDDQRAVVGCRAAEAAGKVFVSLSTAWIRPVCLPSVSGAATP